MHLRIHTILLIFSACAWGQNCVISKPNLADHAEGPVQWFGTGKLRVYLTGREWIHLPLWDAPTIEEMMGPDTASLLRKIPGWQGGFPIKFFGTGMEGTLPDRDLSFDVLVKP